MGDEAQGNREACYGTLVTGKGARFTRATLAHLPHDALSTSLSDGLKQPRKARPETDTEKQPKDGCENAGANSSRIHRDVVIQNVHDDGRQYCDGKRNEASRKKEHPAGELD